MKSKRRLEQAAAVLIALAVWQAAAAIVDRPALLVTPAVVFMKLISICSSPDFLRTAAFSFVRIASGFLLALAAGCALAALAGSFRLVEVLFRPFIQTIKSVPVASFIILCLIVIGSEGLSVLIAFLIVLPIVYTNVVQGIKSTDRKLLEMAKVFRAGLPKKIKYIYLPQLEPHIVSASSVSVGLAWKAGIAGEVIGIPDGSIGEKLYEAKVYLSTAELFAWTVVIILLSIGFEKLFSFILKRLYALTGRSQRWISQ